MIKQLLRFGGAFLAALVIPLALASPAVFADSNVLDNACTGNAGNSAVCNQAKTQGTTDPVAGPNGVISKAANLIAIIAGIGVAIMFVLGGMTIASSGGKPEAVAKGRARITSALIGLILIALGWAIVEFITGKVLR